MISAFFRKEMAVEELQARIVLAVDEDHRSIHALNWLRDDPLGLWTSDVQLDILHVVKEDKDRAKGLELLKKYNVWAKSTFSETQVVTTKLVQCKDGPGVGIRDYTKEINTRLLVMASSNSTSLRRRLVGGVTDYCERFCLCPVIVIKKDRRADIKTNREKTIHVAIAVDTTGPGDNAVDWFLSTANLTSPSTLVIVHAVTKPTEKISARQFLSSYQERCIASKKEYTMKSGLVYFKGKNIAESLVKYCHDYSVDLLILAPQEPDGIKFMNSVTENIVRTIDCDFFVWKSNKKITQNLEIKTRDLTARRSSLNLEKIHTKSKSKVSSLVHGWRYRKY